jgi:Predicted membrane protein (DUF2207)
MPMRSSRLAALTAAAAVALFGLLSLGFTIPQPVSGAAPTLTPYTTGRHVYDYQGSMSPTAIATAEKYATAIEDAGGGRVVVYTADLMELPDDATLARAWHVDGLLLTGWDDMGTATLGDTLKPKLPYKAWAFIGNSSAGMASMESWITSTLARTYGLMTGKHVFDGTGILDTAGLTRAEASATGLAARIGAAVYVDIAIGTNSDPKTTAFFNNYSGDLGKDLVIALAVSGSQIGGYVDADSSLWDSYQTKSPWAYDSLENEAAPNGDIQAELLRAIDAVRKPPDPAEAAATVAGSLRDALTGFFGNSTNQIDSAAGALLAFLAVALFAWDRRRRRREPGYADDESVLVPGPPSDMTPAMAALISSPLDTTRAVTCALLDLAAHGHIAFYSEATPFGPRGGIKVVSAGGVAGTDGHAHAARAGHATAAERPLGPAEVFLLNGLVSAAGKGAALSPTDFAELRPLFEQTGEQLEQTAGQRGWLRMQTRAISRPWVFVGAGLLLVGVAWAALMQPVAWVAEALAGLIILPRALRMPLPLVTPNGAMTSAMVDAYRRTLRRALSGAPGDVPPWLANAEEAALWGYAWGLEGEVESFVGRSVQTAMHGPEGGEMGAPDTASLRSFTMMLGGLSGSGHARPVGLDTDAIAASLSGLARSATHPTDPEASVDPSGGPAER